MSYRLRKIIALLMILILVLGACAQATPTPTPRPTAEPTEEATVEAEAEEPTEEATEVAMADVTEEATEEMAEPTEEATEVMTEEPTEEATEEMAEPTEEATEVMTEEPTEEATEEMAEPTEEATEVMTKEPTEEATEEMAEPTEEATAEATEEAAATIVDIAAGNEDLSILVAAIQAAELEDELSGEGPFTVLAPTNEAFEALLETLSLTEDELLADTELLTQVLLYHVRAGVVDDADILDRTALLTLTGELVFVSSADGTITFNDSAEVVEANVEASNGIIHVINAVLLPPNLEVGGAAEAPTEEATAEATAES